MSSIVGLLKSKFRNDLHFPEKGTISVHNGYHLLFLFNLFLFSAAVVLMEPRRLLAEMQLILFSESHLVTDYIALTSVGTALFNSSMMTFIAIFICYHYRVPMTGGAVSAIFTVTGYGLFGKNLLNFIPIFLGVRLYSYFMNEPLKKFLLIALYGSSVSPVVSFFAFNQRLSPVLGIGVGYLIGIVIGFIMVPLALHFQSLFKRVSLYSAGFTSGMLCTMVAGICRMFGIQIDLRGIVSKEQQPELIIFLVIFGLLLCGYGLRMASKRHRLNLRAIWSHSGKIELDILRDTGVYNTMINMGLMTLLLVGYVMTIDAVMNGPVLGAIFCVIGFSACGAHVFNSVPLLLGVTLANTLNIYAMNETVTVTAAIFAMMLCAITNAYGWKGGLIVGFIHTSMVLNIDVLHGGLNLYNNGFSGGLVAMMIIPLLDLSQQLRNKRAIDQVKDELLDKAGIVLHPIRQEEESTSEEPQDTRLSLTRDN
ncbi:DUF1576 domain-containing protein [Enterococcus sp.]|uniref:DUF1576 domain-containing protein n=1 Tax=Enterococcus sp. TaxID=35783 RepID=UPI0028A8FFEA|nr:DUF1576 domain-containing protein [Enterococcus sp.]